MNLFKNFDTTKSPLHELIFLITIPAMVKENNYSDKEIIKRVAQSIGISPAKYIKYFMMRPDLPSPKSVLDKYRELKNAQK